MTCAYFYATQIILIVFLLVVNHGKVTGNECHCFSIKMNANRSFLKNIVCKGYVNYGCGGLMALRAGTRTPQDALNKPGTECFDNIRDAYKHLQDIKCKNSDRKYLLVSAQFTTNIFECNDGKVDIKEEPNKSNTTGGSNYCSLIQTQTHGWCWEDATGPFKNGNNGLVNHGRNISNPKDFNLFCVIPDSVLDSPANLPLINLEQSLIEAL
jgi:hypothetical protein